MARRHAIKIGHYNVDTFNSHAHIAADIPLLKAEGASVFDLNEGDDVNVVKAALERIGYKYDYNGESDWLAWNPKYWKTMPWHGVRVISPSAKSFGVNIKFNPTRYLGFRCLIHRPSGERHDFYYTHMISGYAKTDPGWSEQVEEFKNFAGKLATLNIKRLTNTYISRRKHVKYHHLLGDINSQQRKDNVWWYPANQWDGIWVPDTRPLSIDWMMHSEKAKRLGMKLHSRYIMGDKPGAAGFDSDHPAHFKVVTFPG